jgi:tRNA pseudouridine55 synthase
MGRRRRRPALNRFLQGVLVLDKPAGITSQDACSEVKALLRLDKVGHAGTLDPFATGVLPLLLNSATRISRYITSGDKHYRGVVKLGVITDTLDPTGTVVERRPVPELPRQRVEDVLESFLGDIEQLPPLYSAVRVDGRRMYDLARAGVDVERKPKQVRIDAIELLRFEGDEIEIEVQCGVGTYVRSLAFDIGEALGCGGHLQELSRTSSGPFPLDGAVSLDRLRELVEEHKALPDEVRPRRPEPERDWWKDKLGSSLKTLFEALPDHQALYVEGGALERVRAGSGLRASDLGQSAGDFAAGAPLLLATSDAAVALARAGCRSDVARRMPPDAIVVELTRLLG